jgi:hypothetical protein
MYKNFTLTESEREQILNQHKNHGYKKPLNEDINLMDFDNHTSDVIQDIDYMGNNGSTCIIGMTLNTFIPNEDSQTEGRMVPIRIIGEWREETEGYGKKKHYINVLTNIQSIEPEVPISDESLEMIKHIIRPNVDLNHFMYTIYGPYIQLIKSKNGDWSKVYNSMNDSVETVKNIIYDNHNAPETENNDDVTS